MLLGTGGMVIAAGTLAFAGGAGAASNSGINGLSKNLQDASKITYQATYVITSSSSPQTTMVIAQAPGKSYFKAGGGYVVSNGKKTYYCGSSGGASPTCFAASTGNPLAGLTALFSPTTIINQLKSVQSEVAGHVAGVSVKTSSKTVAGQPSSCVAVTAPGGAQSTWCAINGKGVLSYEKSAGNSIVLKAFTTNVPKSTFELPSGASTVTIPGGANIPGGGSIPKIPGT